MNSLFIGIDVSANSNVVYFMKPDGSKHSSFTVQNNLNGESMKINFHTRFLWLLLFYNNNFAAQNLPQISTQGNSR